MTLSITLSRYIAKQFMIAIFASWAALSGLVVMFDFIELLRRSASKPEATFTMVGEIAALRIPFIMIQILPFAVMLGGLLCFWRLTRTSELIVARAAGVSAWEFLTAPTLCALILGAFATTGLSPLSSAMLARAEALESAYIRTGGGPLALNGGQLWLRQSDRELKPRGVAIIHASAVALRGDKLTTGPVSVFRLDDSDHLLSRVEAANAFLADKHWDFGGARTIRPDQLPEPPREMRLATDLTVTRVQDSFASPDTLSVWVLPDFISLLERSGFSSVRHRLHFHSLLALPLLCATMALVSAGFSMRPTRRGGVAKMIGGGVSAGFALFVISKVAEEFGQSGALPVILAAWAPAASGLYAGGSVAVAHGRRLSMRPAGGTADIPAGSRATSIGRCARPILTAAILLVFAALAPRTAVAQLSQLATVGAASPATKDEPVTFTADQVEYDRERNLVTARGHVEAWQAGRVVRADQMTFNRETGVVVATGNVVLMEPTGQIMFAEYAELSRDMSEGILKTVRSTLDHNGKLAANGMRRTGGLLNELSRVVYSACDLCKDDPTRPPLWQIEAASAVQDTEHKTIEYRDAVLRMGGIPVAYAPFFWHPDPTVPRQSGLLPPLLGNSSSLGAFYGQPYYWVIDGQSDATITPMITGRTGFVLDSQYRRRFNSGTLFLNLSLGYEYGSAQASFAGRGQFAIDENWRWGFDVNRASSSQFVLNQHILLGLAGDSNVLPSNVYLEGFGDGSYSRVDVKGYQGLVSAISTARLPVVLPRYVYSFIGTPDRLGGRLAVDTGVFNIIRDDGTNTRRANLTLNWERPFLGPVGDLWKITLHGDAAAYDASQFNLQPNFGLRRNIDTARAQPAMAVDFNWPWMRDSGSWGTQLIEPQLQLIISPRTGDSQLSRIPNEDSLSFEFSDANLFGFNRFMGVDRLEGGTRLNAALHGAWYLSGTLLDGLIGQSYRTAKDNMFPASSGLHDEVSDFVARVTFTPTSWLDLNARARLDKHSFNTRMADASVGIGTSKLRLTGGYLYTTFDPYFFYDTAPPPPVGSGFYSPRNEVTATLSSTWDHYRFSVTARRNLTTNQMLYYGATAAYEDECFIFDLRFTRRFTSLLNDHGSTALLFYFTFKTVGQVGYRAI